MAQILESSIIGLRAAELTFRHPEHNLTFIALPMLHIAVPEFYAKIQSRLSECEVVLFEGVGNSIKADLMTASYRWPARRKRLGLVLQSESLDLKELPIKRIHADLTKSKFASSWRTIPFLVRLTVLILAPLYGGYLYLFGSRESIGRKQSLDDLRSRRQILGSDNSWGKVRQVVIDERDAALVKAIAQYWQANKNSNGTAAILFGGGHIPAAIRCLCGELGLTLTTGHWRMAIPV